MDGAKHRVNLVQVMAYCAYCGQRTSQAKFRIHAAKRLAIAQFVVKEPLGDLPALVGCEGAPTGIGAECFHGVLILGL
jgi:hypothetical protein